MNTNPVITITKEKVVFLELKVRTFAQNVREEVAAFVKTLKNSKLLSEDIVSVWQEKFNREHGQILTTDEEREDASAAICFLLCDIILPKMSEKDITTEQEVMILSLEEEMKRILKITLPEDQNVDGFIKDYENASDQEAAQPKIQANKIEDACESKEDELDEEDLLSEKLEEVESLFKKQMTILYASANEENANLRKNFEELKSRLNEVNQSRVDMTERMKLRMHNLMLKFQEASSKLSTTGERSKFVAQKHTEQELQMERILKEAQTVFSER